MKNSYIAIGAVVLVVLLGFLFWSHRTEAPVINTEADQAVNSTVTNFNLTDGQYKLDTIHSQIGWQGEYLSGLSEQGSVKLSSGEFTVENGLIKSGEFIIDLNSIESEPHKDLLVSHLKSDDFFSVATYPTAKFVFQKMEATSAEGAKMGHYVIAGNLTVKGITKPISFSINLSQPTSGTLAASSDLALNRADWEIKYNSATFFKDLGEKIIRDAVSLHLDLQAQKVIQ